MLLDEAYANLLLLWETRLPAALIKSKMHGDVIRITAPAAFPSLMAEVVFVLAVGVQRDFTHPFLA